MMESLTPYLPAIATAIVGMLVCTAGGLTALTGDPDHPASFVPIYLVAALLFITGLVAMTWSPEIGAWVSGQS